MKNWCLAIQPIVYTFPRRRFTSFNTGWILLLPLVSSSLSFSRSDDNEVGEMLFATRHKRVPREYFSFSVILRWFAFDANHTLRFCAQIKCVNTLKYMYLISNTHFTESFKFYLLDENRLVLKNKIKCRYSIENICILFYLVIKIDQNIYKLCD